jgi:hypothetical protein
MERCDSCRNDVDHVTQVEPEYFLCEECLEGYEEQRAAT